MKERKYLVVIGLLLIAALVTSSLIGCTRRKPEVAPPIVEEETPAIGAASEVTPRPIIEEEEEPTALVQPETEEPTLPPLPTSTPEAVAEETSAPAEVVEQPTVVAVEEQPAEGAEEIIVVAIEPTVDPSVLLPVATPPVVPAVQPTAMSPAMTGPEGGSHVVQRGETLYSIARRHGTTYQELMRINGIANANRIYVGQRLTLPGAPAAPEQPAQPAQPAQPGEVYIVKPGDNLFRIALNYGVSVQELANANNIFNPRVIHTGQQLVIPSGSAQQPAPSQPSGQRTYVVQRGDTLFSIATRYGTTVQALMLANNIANRNFIYPGQTLVIP